MSYYLNHKDGKITLDTEPIIAGLCDGEAFVMEAAAGEPATSMAGYDEEDVRDEHDYLSDILHGDPKKEVVLDLILAAIDIKWPEEV